MELMGPSVGKSMVRCMDSWFVSLDLGFEGVLRGMGEEFSRSLPQRIYARARLNPQVSLSMGYFPWT